MPNFHWKKYSLEFKRPSGTSRGILHTKDSWFIIADDASFSMPAMGECSIIEGLSPDPLSGFEERLDAVCAHLNGMRADEPDLDAYPSIRFGLEMLQADIAVNGSKRFFEDDFTRGEASMLINGLVWMGNRDWMRAQIEELVDRGFRCIKLKIGAIEFNEELDLLAFIRSYFPKDLEIRVDANGAFAPKDALEKLKRLSDFELHSIEQPIAVNQWQEMASLCETSPLAIALDEELIHRTTQERVDLLDTITPAYIILKPSLIGGWKVSKAWIEVAESKAIGWWMTSALESNVGLNAITQFTFQQHVHMPQGLGTGSLYTNNLDSPLYIQGQKIGYNTHKYWNLSPITHG